MERINGHDTVDIGNGKRGFRSQNALAGVNGTEVTDAFLNSVQEEICSVIEKAGIVLDIQKNDQLHEALMRIIAPGFGNRIAWMPVKSVTVKAPPTGAAIGDTYVIPAGATGAWSGHSQKLAEWNGSTWNVISTKDGHGVGLPDGRVFERINGAYVEFLASRDWVNSQTIPVHRLKNLPWVTVISVSETTPPASPSEGDLYVIPNGATGAWEGHSQKLVEWYDGAWKFRGPPNGHGVSLADGRVFERVNHAYTEFLASRDWVNNRKAPITQHLNVLPWLPVKSITQTAPPAAPDVGDTYIIPAGATGTWAGKTGQVAEWSGGAWWYKTPPDGHGVSLADGRIFECVSGSYIEKQALDTQSGKWTYAEAGGSANALTAMLTPALITYTPGFQVNIKIVTNNTGAATINVNGRGVKSIVDRSGTALSAGDLVAGEVVTLVYDGTRFRTVWKSEGSNQSMGGAGWVKLPGGLIMQWGGFSGPTNPSLQVGGVYESNRIPVGWPIAFPNAIFQVVAGCGTDVGGVGLQEQAWFTNWNKTSGDALVACRQASATLSGSFIVFGN